ncbi:MAG: hypothetical protein WAM92_11520, partial [Mycobacterium sp.]
CALVMIPAYLVGTPDAPRTPQAARDYYGRGLAFVTANGTLPLLHILFGLAFLGVLVAMLRHAAGPSAAVYTALAGGVFFFALTAAGLAAEVAYPATVLRFGNMPITEFDQPLLTLATWLYHYCQIGAAAMIFATSVAIWRTGVLPKVTAALGVFGLPPLVHYSIPLPAALSSLLWIFMIGLIMILAPPTARESGSETDRSAGQSTSE